MPESGPREVWASGTAYEPYVGRWSWLVAREFLRWLNLPAGGRWLDVGCGTGALTSALTEFAAPATVIAIDRSIDYARYARLRVSDRRSRYLVADGARLPLQPGKADAVVSGLVLNFLSDPAAGVSEMMRVVRIGGTVAAYVWDYAGQMELMRYFWDTAVELDPAAAELDEGRRFPLCDRARLLQLWESVGLADVETQAIDVTTRFSDFDDYWRPFLGGQGPAPGYVTSLNEERRAGLRERLRERLPFEADGHLELGARAWAVRGRRAASPIHLKTGTPR